jgi:pre-mRNA cleavage complex 2 protein Pcf11
VTDQSTSIDLVPVANGSDPSSSTAVTGSASTSTGVGPAAAKTSATLSAALRAELMKKTIIQPSDPEVAARPCPICKEAFKGDFEEEEEEWVWHNAVEEDGVVSLPFCSVALL